MLLWWGTRCCVWFHCLLLEDITRTLLPLLKPHWSTGTFVEGTSCRFTVHCTGLAKARCSFLPCFLTCWESAVSPDTVWPKQKWPPQSVQQPKKSGSEMNCCPSVFSLSAPGHSLPSGGFGKEAVTHPPGLPRTLSNLGTLTRVGLILAPPVRRHRGTSPLRRPMSQAGAGLATSQFWWDGHAASPGRIPHSPWLTFPQLSFFSPFSFSHLLTCSYTNERVTLFPEPESLELHSTAWAMLLPSSSPSKQCPSMSVWNIEMYCRNCSRWFWLFFHQLARLGITVSFEGKKRHHPFYILSILTLM